MPLSDFDNLLQDLVIGFGTEAIMETGKRIWGRFLIDPFDVSQAPAIRGAERHADHVLLRTETACRAALRLARPARHADHPGAAIRDRQGRPRSISASMPCRCYRPALASPRQASIRGRPTDVVPHPHPRCDGEGGADPWHLRNRVQRARPGHRPRATAVLQDLDAATRPGRTSRSACPRYDRSPT